MKDNIHNKTVRWTFSDGPTAGKTFEHDFAVDGSVRFRTAGDKWSDKQHYEVAQISDDVLAVSYLAAGWTLTSILDFRTHAVTAFASNDKQLVVQHGTFETLRAAA